MNLEYRTELIKKYPDEQEKLLDYSQMEIFEIAKGKDLLTQDNVDSLAKFNQDQQNYLEHPVDKINLEEVQNKINVLKEIYMTSQKKNS